ncbi:hypothetical protein RCF27_03370 [Rhodococcus pyridinivorans]|uniref:Ligand-binding SRPBCC domain-containing protein n=2 Tax=Rhodococcus pyridinivorans TaxID=103816 RepID=A0A7M2XP79_9NOCA|nr:hypothetical protein [Rhodococcus pyridinivorans]QOV99437.1 hypothetical protein INP59_03265 [Rhodococcus pyridinivorans]WMM73387.1 hypothetical protein RCF27_03370 [Rhodococcus pyridinivorans]
MRSIRLETELPTSADRAWEAMLSPVTFLYVVRGLFGMPALAGRATPLREGERGSGWLWVLHVLPAYRHTIEVVEVDPATRTVRTREHGGVLRQWNHTLHVEPAGEHRCRYSDVVDIDAGRLTPVAVAVAGVLFRYRQRRWHRLVRKHYLP